MFYSFKLEGFNVLDITMFSLFGRALDPIEWNVFLPMMTVEPNVTALKC